MTDQSFIHLCHMVRIGEITQPQPRYDNPEDYGLTRKDSINARIRYLRQIKEKKVKAVRVWTKQSLIQSGRAKELSLSMLLDANIELDAIDKEIKYNLSRLKYKEDTPHGYDIAHIKTIPMDRITKILPNGFFINNPFRNEKSPSNSLHWDKRSNRYTDFGTGLHGDIIDLFMAINKCTIQEAMKELSTAYL